MSKKEFNPIEWKNKKPESSQCSESSERPIRPISPIGHISPIKTLDDEIEQLVCSIESSCKDIAPDYTSWRDLAFALADALGEGGRQYFHRLSRFYSAYDEREADKQFSACLRSHGSGITINTLFHLAKEAGVLMIRNTVKPYPVKKEKKEKSSVEDLEDLSEMSDIPESSQCSESSEPLPTFSQEIYSLLPSLLTSVINKSNNFEDADILILGSLTVISACLPNISGNYAEREVFPNLFTFISAQASAGKGRLTLCRSMSNILR